MKYNFTKIPNTKTIGFRLAVNDYNKITKLAKKHNRTRGGIVAILISTVLKEKGLL